MKTMLKVLAAGWMLVAGLRAADASRIQDLTRLKGDQPNQLVGIGLVFGLKGTGDGGDYQPAMRPLAEMLKKFGDPVTITKELKSSANVAIVTLSVAVPPAGAHAGDKLDVKVSAIAAKSLKGGRLFVCPLQGPDPKDPTIYAFASGDLALDDEQHPTAATIRSGGSGGAVLAYDFVPETVVDGKFTLVLQGAAANFANATAIADQINEDVSPQTDGKAVATAMDATSVVVQIPRAEAARPAAFIARVQQLPVPNLPGLARVVINSKTKTIVFSGDVELAPTMISHNGLTISVAAASTPAAAQGGSPLTFIALDPHRQGSAKLKDLVDAFNLLKVGAEDRITIIKQLYESGALRCQLQID